MIGIRGTEISFGSFDATCLLSLNPSLSSLLQTKPHHDRHSSKERSSAHSVNMTIIIPLVL